MKFDEKTKEKINNFFNGISHEQCVELAKKYGIVEATGIESEDSHISEEDKKKYRKQGRLSGAVKREPLYRAVANNFERDYDKTDFTIRHGCE